MVYKPPPPPSGAGGGHRAASAAWVRGVRMESGSEQTFYACETTAGYGAQVAMDGGCHEEEQIRAMGTAS